MLCPTTERALTWEVVSISLTFPPLTFSSSASLLCLRSLQPWPGLLVQDLQHHLSAAPGQWELLRGCAEISPAAHCPGPGAASEGGCHFPANSCQVPLRFQPQRLLQYLPSKCSSCPVEFGVCHRQLRLFWPLVSQTQCPTR